MKLPWLLFALCLAMCAVLGYIGLFVEEAPFEETQAGPGEPAHKVYLGHGFVHPEYPSMEQGGPGAARHSKILFLGWLFGILQIAFFVSCLALAQQKGGRLGPLFKPIAVGGFLFALVFTFFILSYRAYMNEDAHSLFLFQVRPTAWMLYGVWGFPVYFLVVYVLTFKSWFVTDEDLVRFREIVAEKRASESEGA